MKKKVEYIPISATQRLVSGDQWLDQSRCIDKWVETGRHGMIAGDRYIYRRPVPVTAPAPVAAPVAAKPAKPARKRWIILKHGTIIRYGDQYKNTGSPGSRWLKSSRIGYRAFGDGAHIQYRRPARPSKSTKAAQ